MKLQLFHVSVGETASGMFTEEWGSSAAPPRGHWHKLPCETKPRQSQADLSSHFSGRLHAVVLSVAHTSLRLLGIHSQPLWFITTKAANCQISGAVLGWLVIMDRSSAVIYGLLTDSSAGTPTGSQEKERRAKKKGLQFHNKRKICVFFILDHR